MTAVARVTFDHVGEAADVGAGRAAVPPAAVRARRLAALAAAPRLTVRTAGEVARAVLEGDPT